MEEGTSHREPDLGDLVLSLLHSTLSGLAERLKQDGYHIASETVQDCVERVDEHLAGISS